ncbi:MAG: TolC family protein [Pseudomonadota bacterium]
MKRSVNQQASIPAIILVASAALLLFSTEGLCQNKMLTLDQAVKSALLKGPGVSAAEYNIKAAEYGKKKAFTNFFPIYTAELRALYYSKKSGLGDFDMSGLAFDPALIPLPDSENDTAFDQFMYLAMQGMGDAFSNMGSLESEQYDVMITLSMVQPLTPLYQVYYGYKLADLGIDVAQIELAKTRRDLTYQVKNAYFTILKLGHGIDAMDEAIASVQGHVAKAELFFQQKVITKNDVLQAKARLAQLEAQRIQLDGTLEIVHEGLNSAAGLKSGTVSQLQEPQEKFAGVVPTFDEAMKEAMQNRPDLKGLEIMIEQANQVEKIAVGEFIPQVSAIVNYQHNEGSVMEYPPFAFGAVLNWNFWTWGKNTYGLKQARMQIKAIKEAHKSMKAVVAVEVKEALSRLRVSALTLEKAEASVTASEEQLRIENERYAQNVNTSTEVLDAQTRLTQSKLERENAKYDIYIALALLEKVTGKAWQ